MIRYLSSATSFSKKFMQRNERVSIGIWYAVATAIVSGIAIAYSKFAVAKIDPLLLTTSRNLYVALLFTVLLLKSKRIQEIYTLERKDVLRLLLIGIIGGALPFYLFFTGLQWVSAPVANIIHKTLFVWVAVLATLFLKEKIRPLYVVSYAVIIWGTFFIAPVTLSIGKGEQYVFFATLLWAIEYLLAKMVLRRVSPNIVGLFRMGIGSVVLSVALFALKGPGVLLTYDLSKIVIVVLGGTLLFLYVFFWYRALQYAPSGLVSLVLTLSIVVSTVIGGSFTGGHIPAPDAVSSVLISTGIATVALPFILKRRVISDRLS